MQRAAITPAVRVRQEFEQYLLRERGLAAASIRLYGDVVGRFLQNAFGDAEVRLDQLTAANVIHFGQANASHLHHPKRAQVMTTALRSFLRYGRYCGDIVTDLPACVPTVANGSMAGIPKTISPAQVQNLLAKCNQQSAAGIRDYAMLVLISRRGRRAGEVVDLTLDDLDWTDGAIRIRGPAQRIDRLPLPIDVGIARLITCATDAPRAPPATCLSDPTRLGAHCVGRVPSVAWCAAPRGARESIRLPKGRTCCVIPWRRRCSARAPRLARSRRSFVIAIRKQP